jgi:hypothetical protein
MAKRTKIPKNRYFLSRKQMEECQVVEWIAKSKIKRGEGKYYLLHKCGCGCGVFHTIHGSV